MSIVGLFHPRVLATLGFGAIVAVATAGFAAANTVPGTQAGDGAGTVSGYAITNVHYNLNASNPTNIDSVTFDAAPAPPAGSSIRVKLVNAGTTWFTCTDTGNDGLAVSCTTSGATAAAADSLRVVVSQ